MQRNPFLIAKEYVQPGEPAQVRKNALTALAVLNNPSSLALLADVALADADTEVREQAEAEIALLMPESAAAALQPVLDDLKRRGRRRGAYALLGRLRNRGISFRFPGLPLWTRLRLAGSMRNQLYPKRGVLFHLRTFWGATAGALVAWIVMVVLASGPYDFHMEPASEIGYLLAGWSIAVLVSMLATAFTTPARYHADPTGGALFDASLAAALALPLAGGSLAMFRPTGGEITHPIAMLVLMPAAAAAVRVGTLAAFGILRGGAANRLLQIGLGGACGSAVFQWGAIAAGRIGDTIYASTWMMLMVVAYALAGAYAWIDGRGSRKPVTAPAVRWLALVCSVAGVLPLVLPLISLPQARFDLGNVESISKWPQSFDVRRVPADITMHANLPFDCFVNSSLIYPREFQRWDDASTKWEPAGNINRPPGQYRWLVERSQKDVSVFLALPELGKMMAWPQTMARLRRTVAATGPTLDTVTVIVKPQNLGRPPGRPRR
jgi:hypothetical protein